MKPTNIFAPTVSPVSGEVFQQLLSGAAFHLERIVSTGQTTAAGEWSNQDRDEWVLLLSGAARLRFKGPDELLEMKPGDYIKIAAHRQHRVEWTDPERESVWLALHYSTEGMPERIGN